LTQIRELPVNNLPILIIIIDTDFTDLHRCYLEGVNSSVSKKGQ